MTLAAGAPGVPSAPPVQLSTRQAAIIEAVYDKYDTDGEGNVSTAELGAMIKTLMLRKPTDRAVEDLLTSTGKDEGSVINKPEFVTMISQHMSLTTHWGQLSSPALTSHVGIDKLTAQANRRVVQAGFQFNIMTAGASGLGKSTMIDTLFGGAMSRHHNGTESRAIPKTVEVHSTSHLIEEEGVRLRLTIVDTPGFGDQIDNTEAWMPLVEYQNKQFDRYYAEEQAYFRRRDIPDTRIHCILYFIAPTGHFLKPFDIEAMKELSVYYNIIPVIAKADSMTIAERDAFRKRIRADFEYHDVHVYPQIEDEDSEEEIVEKEALYQQLPYAVVGSNQVTDVGGKKVLGRDLGYSVVEIENPHHCEYTRLRDVLIRERLYDLVETTHMGQYGDYRFKRLDPEGQALALG